MSGISPPRNKRLAHGLSPRETAAARRVGEHRLGTGLDANGGM